MAHAIRASLLAVATISTLRGALASRAVIQPTTRHPAAALLQSAPELGTSTSSSFFFHPTASIVAAPEVPPLQRNHARRRTLHSRPTAASLATAHRQECRMNPQLPPRTDLMLPRGYPACAWSASRRFRLLFSARSTHTLKFVYRYRPGITAILPHQNPPPTDLQNHPNRIQLP